ncbi:hypothetical protein, partial [Paenibacillus larvae]|uniref:hypothetical protein n=3 Tax=Paenibacillus larvae TaxID=1464 RepID=UPI00399051E7
MMEIRKMLVDPRVRFQSIMKSKSLVNFAYEDDTNYEMINGTKSKICCRLNEKRRVAALPRITVKCSSDALGDPCGSALARFARILR